MFSKYKIGLFLCLVVAFVLPAGAGATTSTETLLQEIQKLQAQIKSLSSQQSTLIAERNEAVLELLKMLKEGDEGDEVKILQALLAMDESIYPEGLITGRFGPLTSRALVKFQLKHGLEGVGFVGPKTRILLNKILKQNKLELEEDGEDSGKGKKVCARIAFGHLVAKGWLKKDSNQKPIVPECRKLPFGIEKKLKDGMGTTTGTTTDTRAPKILRIRVQAEDDEAKITWTTDEKATSRVYYRADHGSSTPAEPTAVSSARLEKFHSLTIPNLTASSTYYFWVESTDKAGNTATSSQKNFVTDADDEDDQGDEDEDDGY